MHLCREQQVEEPAPANPEGPQPNTRSESPATPESPLSSPPSEPEPSRNVPSPPIPSPTPPPRRSCSVSLEEIEDEDTVNGLFKDRLSDAPLPSPMSPPTFSG